MACLERLRALLASVAEQGCSLDVVLGHSLRWQWPWRPGCGAPGVLCFQAGGKVSVGELRKLVAELPEQCDGIMPAFASEESVDLLAFVQALATPKQPGPLYAQVVFALGELLDHSYWRVLTMRGLSINGISICRAELDVDSVSRSELDRHMCAYVKTSAALGSDAMELSIALDKSRVFGRGLMSFAVVMPNNLAWWAPPQARSGSILCSGRMRSNTRCFCQKCVRFQVVFFLHSGSRFPEFRFPVF